VDLVGFDITGGYVYGITQDANYGRVIGNRVHDLANTAAYTTGIDVDCCANGYTGNQILGNVVDNIGPYPTSSATIQAIYSGAPNTVIANNIVTRAAGACIHLWHSDVQNILANNTLANCAHWGILIGGGTTNAGYNTVINNIVVNTGGGGAGDAAGLIEYNSAAGPGNVFYNNILYNNLGTPTSLITGTQAGTLTLTSAQFSALFVNYTGDRTGDYHLQSGAVAQNAGTTVCASGVTACAPLKDFDGLARPLGTAWAIGAYEQ
jgi:parallel beta-helix repeat protein